MFKERVDWWIGRNGSEGKGEGRIEDGGKESMIEEWMNANEENRMFRLRGGEDIEVIQGL
jgi:hypothetical protein